MTGQVQSLYYRVIKHVMELFLKKPVSCTLGKWSAVHNHSSGSLYDTSHILSMLSCDTSVTRQRQKHLRENQLQLFCFLGW